METFVYGQTTHDIQVEVLPTYVPEQTQFPNQFLFSYNVSITNSSSKPCQLLRRHWVIVDGVGHKEEVSGEGVVGDKPHLEPGANYQYSSYCPLPTPTGNMRGYFTFVDSEGKEFQVRVPLFFLRDDAILN